MAGYENNHYVPRLVLRRYGDRINKYNLKTKEYIVSGNIKSAFNEKNLYPEELEKRLASIEGKFADLLNNKLLKEPEKIVLHRDEIWLIKKFLVLEMFRVPDALSEHRTVKDSPEFSSAAYGFKEKKIDGESYRDYIFRTMNVIIDANSFDDIIKNPNKTYESAKWFLLYNNCYLTFWDSTNSNEDFFITDRGMTCEHEKTRFEFEQYGFKEELIKSGYILSKVFDESLPQNQKDAYFELMEKSRFVYANYYMFSISATRMIGLINPWYRLHFDNDLVKKLGVPEVYPCMLSKEALETNTVKYINQFKIDNGTFDPEKDFDSKDEYIYNVKYISFEDVCIINCMMLDRAYEMIGFAEANKIKKSLNIYTKLLVKLNDYNALKEKLINDGYDFSNSKKYNDFAFEITHIKFTPEELKYINKMFELQKMLKDVKI